MPPVATASARPTAPAECSGDVPPPPDRHEQPEADLAAPLPPPAASRCGRVVERYADLVADYPGMVCCVVLVVVCLFIMLCGAVASMEDEFIVIDFSLDSMQARGDEISDRDEALSAAWCGGPCDDDDHRLRRRLDDRGLSSHCGGR
ncbi:unnamed protein product [Prorocentrum cordatum]|uniref:Uncharacterized protein n=1 Tax=Prorocentrum cordatum TaxID=2364126 RepID=A0ABN9THE0_9DINO|nr:unnamed protein product [Polarella glacialis]